MPEIHRLQDPCQHYVQFWNVKLPNPPHTTVRFTVPLLSHCDPCLSRQGWNPLLRRGKPKLLDTLHHGDLSSLVCKEKTPSHRLVGYSTTSQFWLVKWAGLGWWGEDGHQLRTCWREVLGGNLWESYPECCSSVQNIQVPSPLRTAWPH